MELRHIYGIANAIRAYADSFEKEDVGLPTNNPLPTTSQTLALDDLEVVVNVSPSTHYGIDKEFYRLTHKTNEGFEHKDGDMHVTIDGIKFCIKSK